MISRFPGVDALEIEFLSNLMATFAAFAPAPIYEVAGPGGRDIPDLRPQWPFLPHEKFLLISLIGKQAPLDLVASVIPLASTSRARLVDPGRGGNLAGA